MSELTIALVVRNGASTIQRAIESLLAQTFTGFQLNIFDNASTDDTPGICQKYEKLDPRVRYTRHERDIGAAQNLHDSLKSADSEFFMWAAADDVWAPGHVLENLEILKNNKTIAASQSRVLFTQDGIPTRMSEGTYALAGSKLARTIKFLLKPADNSRFYGVHRTALLKAAFPGEHFFAYDWAVSATVLTAGTYHELEDVMMIRDETAAQSYANSVSAFARSPLDRAMPLARLARSILSGRGFWESLSLVPILAWLNFRIALRFITLRRTGSGGGAKVFSPGMRERLKAMIGRSSLGLFNVEVSPTASVEPSLAVICIARNAVLPLLQIGTAIKRSGRSDIQWIIADFESDDVTVEALAGIGSCELFNAEMQTSLAGNLKRATALARAPLCLCLFADQNAPKFLDVHLKHLGKDNGLLQPSKGENATFEIYQSNFLGLHDGEPAGAGFQSMAEKLRLKIRKATPEVQAAEANVSPKRRAT